jgi:hypothetical protein
MTGTVTQVEIRHALKLVAAERGLGVPNPDDSEYWRLAHNAVNTLLGAVWIYGQAAEMNISVTRKQVSQAVTRLKEQFNTPAEYRMFVRRMKYTRRDVRERVEQELLATRIQQRVVSQAKSKTEAAELLHNFVAAYNGRWRRRTVCATDYAAPRCSNAPKYSQRP